MKYSLWIFACATVAVVAADADRKQPDVNNYPFWTGGKKQGPTTQFVPGLNAALQLTENQIAQIASARAELMENESVKATRSIGKSDPGVTAEHREKARATIEEANARLREKVAAILTPEQRTLIEKVNAAHAAAVEEAGIIYADKFASPSIKIDPGARQRLQEEKNHDTREQFLQKLDGILSPEQRDAVARAAAGEAERNAQSAGAKKPAKP